MPFAEFVPFGITLLMGEIRGNGTLSSRVRVLNFVGRKYGKENSCGKRAI